MVKRAQQGSMRELLVHHMRPLLLCFLITAGGTVAFYTYSVIGPKIIQDLFASGDAMTGVILNLLACREIGRASLGKECRSRWSPYH